MYQILLPTRYLLKRPISYLAIVAVALCVFIVVVVMTIMNGLVQNFRQKNHDFAGDCVVYTDSLVGFPFYEEFDRILRAQDFVEATSVTAKGFGILSQPNRDSNLVIEVVGIDPARHAAATGFGETLHYHQDNPDRAFENEYQPSAPGCVVGIDMMPGGRDQSGEYYHPDSPRYLELMISCFPLTARGALARAGTRDYVNTKSFFYSDDTHSGLVKVDASVVYIPLEWAQQLCGMASATPRAGGIHIRFTEKVNLEKATEQVRGLWEEFLVNREDKRYDELLATVKVEDWKVYRKETIAPMEREQAMLSVLFAMLGLITVFVVFVVFYMIVSHKSRDIGILKSVGVSAGNVALVFIHFAAGLGVLGSLIGIGGAAVFLRYINGMENWLFEQYGWQLWDRSVYAIGKIPNELRWEVLAVTLVCAVAASLIGAWMPVWKAARQPAAQVLQVSQI